MPKLVDHAERRERIVHAVWDQLLDGGFEAVTLRKVADRAGISMGQIQHYFASREEMVHAALALAAQELTTNIEASLGTIAEPTAEQALRAMLEALLGLEPEGRRVVRISAAILGRAVSDPAMAALLSPEDNKLDELTASLIIGARLERGAPPPRYPERDAALCWTVATSLGIEVALGYRSAEDALALLHYQLARTLL